MRSSLLSSLLLAPCLAVAQSSTTASRASTSTAVAAQFTVPSEADNGVTLLPNIDDPSAPNAQLKCPGYTATGVRSSSTGLTAQLTLNGSACNVYGTDVRDLDLTVEYQTSARLHVNIRPSHITYQNQSWYLLSTDYVPAATQGRGSMTTSDLTFSWTNSPRTGFGFNVTRNSTGDVLFSTTGTKLVFENQFIELVTHQDEGYNLYGLGEVIHGLRLGNNFTRTIYAADVGDPIDTNLYGSHPFYLQTKYFEVGDDNSTTLVTEQVNTTDTGNYTSATHGVYFRNAHGMEVLLHPTNVTWRTLGGSVDLYFFSGPTQPEVTQQYQSVIGLPALQSYWAFGFHQCRWGYENWTVTEDVVNNYERFGIPLETIWNDIDYMFQYRDFDNDPLRFNYSDGTAFLQRLHERGQHYVPIIDAAIYAPDPTNASDAYAPFNDGNDTNSFLLNPDGSLYIGAVWPGYTVFPDWLQPSAHAWWKNQLVTYHQKLPIDGAWIDMSEVSSFCVGSCGTGNLTLNPVHPPFKLPGEPGNVVYDYPEGFNITNATAAASASSASQAQATPTTTATATATDSISLSSSSSSTSYLRSTPTPGLSNRNINYPPYVINHVQGNHDLAVHAVSPNATHHNGVVEYDVHNLFGHQILQATYAGLLAAIPDKRPFIIGRSTFPGSGTVAGHWGGDNNSKFLYMYFSIPQALSFSLFGIPMFGVDTCGFNGNSDEELCNRWMQLSAFFPFYRNHNVLSANPQEAYVWASVIDATKTAMNVRFQLLPYLYTLFYYAHTRGDTVMRALAWEFPHDASLANADRQFFLGPSILVTPVLTQGATSVSGVFPGLVEGTDTYYDWYNKSPIPAPNTKNTTIAAPLGHIPVFIRGGSILATQQMAMTTRAARDTSWSILVAPGIDGSATGSLYLDDGESLAPNATKLVSLTCSPASNGTLSLRVVVSGNFTGLDLPLANVTFLGVQSAPSDNGVTINGRNVGNGTYNSAAKTFSITNLANVLGGKAWGGNWTLSA
ncbi:alpha-glucosidase [Cladophialophora yegresii CBS 114405]|uniref:alpha-glucosidase n=1 Tax=Cladophialophora yegresii CBS 114405 TaxID=1182544 RepID=W9WC32_9EURO|nr:alpha-glucosidase [Cladophialophora yegresii CBS 114405]EXJ62126.1 alpha-glucosidase [Cladophialophora yegresii CBS 114405]